MNFLLYSRPFKSNCVDMMTCGVTTNYFKPLQIFIMQSIIFKGPTTVIILLSACFVIAILRFRSCSTKVITLLDINLSLYYLF